MIFLLELVDTLMNILKINLNLNSSQFLTGFWEV